MVIYQQREVCAFHLQLPVCSKIKEEIVEELRSQFGMVLQDTWLFRGTIAENVAYGKPGATREEIIEACDRAYCDHFIRTLPEGYDTVVGDDLSNLSGGQKQLLTIARAMLADRRLAELRTAIAASLRSYVQTVKMQLRDARDNERLISGSMAGVPEKEKQGCLGQHKAVVLLVDAGRQTAYFADEAQRTEKPQ